MKDGEIVKGCKDHEPVEPGMHLAMTKDSTRDAGVRQAHHAIH